MSILSTVKITQSQTHLLLAMFLSGTPEEAHNLTTRSAKSFTSSQALHSLGFIGMVGDMSTVTPSGQAELLHNGYIADDGSMTEFGQKYYQSVVADLNEFYIIRELLLRN